MAIHKFANLEVLSAELAHGGNRRLRRAMAAQGLNPGAHCTRKVAHRHHFDYEPRPGYIYVRSRAISSRCNDNYDEFPAEEIKKAYGSFIGKPVFVNHHNEDHRRMRGAIIDAALHEDANPDGSPDTWVEVLMEVDAMAFPKLAKAILAGHIDRTSMGCDVSHSECSACGNKARTPLEYCDHIARMKGQRFRRTTASGRQEDVLIREVCRGLSFFENSLLVEDPADPTAYFLGVDDHSKTASKTAAKLTFTHPGSGEIFTRTTDANYTHVSFKDGKIAWHSSRQAAERRSDEVYRLEGAPAAPSGGGECVVCQGTGETSGGLRADGLPSETHTCHRCGGSGIRPTSTKRPKVATDEPWLVTMDDEGNTKSYYDTSDPEGQAIARELIESHRSHGGIFFVPECELCTRFFGEDGEHWGSDEARRSNRAFMDRQAKTAITADELGRMSEIVTRHLGHYNAAVTWHLQHRPDASADTIANIIAERDGSAVEKMTGQPGYVNSYDEWWPKMVAATQAMLDEIRGGTTASVQRQTHRTTATQRNTAHTPRNPAITRAGGLSKAASRHQAIDEVRVPTDVDTLADSSCPVCGEDDAFNGDECGVCGFIRPPDPFMDPDLEVAQEVDLRQDAGEQVTLEDDGQPGEDEPRMNEQFKLPKTKKSKITNPSEEEDMRPALAAIARQQKTINTQARQITDLRRGLFTMAKLAGMERHPAIIAVVKRADEDNPAQPVPEPPAEGGEDTDVTNVGPSGGNLPDSPTTPGSTSETEVAPDATTTVDSDFSTDLDVTPYSEDQDVTKPVAGTEGPRPLSETKIETDVRIDEGAATNTEEAFPVGEVPAFAEQQKTTDASKRAFAALRLARLRIQAGIEAGDDLTLGTTIAQSDVSDSAIASEIGTLEAVAKAKPQGQPRPRQARNLVPRSASNERGQPSLAAVAAGHSGGPDLVTSVTDDEILW